MCFSTPLVMSLVRQTPPRSHSLTAGANIKTSHRDMATNPTIARIISASILEFWLQEQSAVRALTARALLTPRVINLFINDVTFLEGSTVQRELPGPEVIENYNTA